MLRRWTECQEEEMGRGGIQRQTSPRKGKVVAIQFLSPLFMGLCTLHRGKVVLRELERWKLGRNPEVEVFSIVRDLCRVPILELGWN